MVKIRKKSSRRMSTAMREKITKKASEKRRKDKKAGKKDVTWRSNKPKDPGIPNSFPYKDQLLAEQQQEKQRLEEEKQARKEALRNGTATLASTAALAAAISAESSAFDDNDDIEDDKEAQVQDSSLKLHAKSLRKVLEASDVILEVLDARDPVGTRCKAVERELKTLDGGRKKLVLVLNKIDLVPAPVVQDWLAYLRTQAPTIPFKSSTQQQRKNLSSSSTSTPNSAAGSSTKPLMELVKGFRLSSSSGPSTSTSAPVKQSLTIGLIGHPNVGKSSVINTLKRSRACSVAPTPGWTKEVQEIVLEKGVRVLDCPGVVVESRGETEGALRGTVKIEDIADPKTPVELILQRCKKEHLQMLYNIPSFENTVTAFLLQVARSKGRLRKGGVPDLDGTAKSVVRDWVAGRIPYYTSPPTAAQTSASQAQATTLNQPLGTVTSDDVGSASLHTQFAPAFDLAALFGEADALAFGDHGEAGSAVQGKGVKMTESIDVEPEDANVGWVTEERDEMEEDDDDEGAQVDDLLEDDDEDDDNEEAIELEADESGDIGMQDADTSMTSTTSKKRARGPEIVSMAPSTSKRVKQTKSVSFSSTPLGPTGSGNARPSSAALNKQQIESELTDEVGLNKNMRKQAKKQKKKQAAKMEKVAQEIEKEFGQDADVVLDHAKLRKSKVVGGANVDEAYDFSEFFGKPQQTKGAEMVNDHEEEL
ncbi:nuclear GTP-binding protein nug1 [Microbotryomycetes sp. JL201]|nr:nuclear GTP-binding protein nug1 [Microbotryomycetes sp. JL201]